MKSSAEIHDWSTVRHEFEGTGRLLVGNGVSIALYGGFAYNSLYRVAVNGGKLDVVDQQLFDATGTGRDFEGVMRRLRTSGDVAATLSMSREQFDHREQRVRSALIDTVVNTHLPWSEVPAGALDRMRSELRKYREVFTTNYDLLLYWAAMRDADGAPPFKNLFWQPDGSFDPLDTEIRDGSTGMYWLHGGVHLERMWDGTVRKRKSVEANLLATFGESNDAVPLIISEGSGDMKRRKIEGSPYLAHCYMQLATPRDSITIVGSGLSATSDGHILEAIKHSKPARVAVSLYRPDHGRAAELWGRLTNILGVSDIRIFDAATHPLFDLA